MRLPTRALLILPFSLLAATSSALAQAARDSTTEIGAGEGFRARLPGRAIVARDSTVVPAGVIRRARWTSSLDHPTYRLELAEYPAGSLGHFPPAKILESEIGDLATRIRGTV